MLESNQSEFVMSFKKRGKYKIVAKNTFDKTKDTITTFKVKKRGASAAGGK